MINLNLESFILIIYNSELYFKLMFYISHNMTKLDTWLNLWKCQIIYREWDAVGALKGEWVRREVSGLSLSLLTTFANNKNVKRRRQNETGWTGNNIIDHDQDLKRLIKYKEWYQVKGKTTCY